MIRSPFMSRWINMRTEEAVPVRLADYRPPDWLGACRIPFIYTAKGIGSGLGPLAYSVW
jgi:hypothetical protein